MKTGLLFSFLFFLSCSTSNKKEIKVEQAQKIPEWVTDQEEYCSDSILCAAGEGESFFYADLNAKKGLAAIFQSKVTGRTRQTLKSFQDDVTSELSEESEVSVNEKIDEVLEGATITKRARYQNLYFSLAELSKVKLRELYQSRLEEIQSQLQGLFQKRSRSTFLKIHQLIEEEKKLMGKLAIVDGIKPNNRSYKKWLALDRSLPRRKVCVANVGVFQKIDRFVTSLVNSIGHKVVPGDDRCEYLLKIVTQSKKEFLKVKGFKKISVQTFLEFLSRKGETLGSIELKESETGRSYSQARSKILKKVRADIITQFNQLNIP